MQWKLKQILAEYTVKTGQALTYEEITEATGLSSNTLSTIATNKARRADLGTIETLLAYLGGRLQRQLQTSDLLEYVPE